jgi:hypothetical protein
MEEAPSIPAAAKCIQKVLAQPFFTRLVTDFFQLEHEMLTCKEIDPSGKIILQTAQKG